MRYGHRARVERRESPNDHSLSRSPRAAASSAIFARVSVINARCDKPLVVVGTLIVARPLVHARARDRDSENAGGT